MREKIRLRSTAGTGFYYTTTKNKKLAQGKQSPLGGKARG